jgi:hypothetical protein
MTKTEEPSYLWLIYSDRNQAFSDKNAEELYFRQIDGVVVEVSVHRHKSNSTLRADRDEYKSHTAYSEAMTRDPAVKAYAESRWPAYIVGPANVAHHEVLEAVAERRLHELGFRVPPPDFDPATDPPPENLRVREFESQGNLTPSER